MLDFQATSLETIQELQVMWGTETQGIHLFICEGAAHSVLCPWNSFC